MAVKAPVLPIVIELQPLSSDAALKADPNSSKYFGRWKRSGVACKESPRTGDNKRSPHLRLSALFIEVLARAYRLSEPTHMLFWSRRLVLSVQKFSRPMALQGIASQVAVLKRLVARIDLCEMGLVFWFQLESCLSPRTICRLGKRPRHCKSSRRPDRCEAMFARWCWKLPIAFQSNQAAPIAPQPDATERRRTYSSWRWKEKPIT